MPFISVTRLKVRSLRYLPSFLWQTLKVASQARHSPGFLGGRILREANNVFWTVTAWEDEEAIRSALRNRLHTDGVKRFHTEDFLGSFGSGIFTAHRVGPVWMRCSSCAQVMKQDQTDGNSNCNSKGKYNEGKYNAARI